MFISKSPMVKSSFLYTKNKLNKYPIHLSKNLSHKASDLLEKSQYNGLDFKINQNASVQDAVLKFSSYNIGCLAVVNNKDQLYGIVTHMDFIRKVASRRIDPLNMKVEEICTKDPELLVGCRNDSFEACISKMHFRNISHIPIVDGHSLIGMLSLKDLWDYLIEKDKDLVLRLKNLYIHYLRRGNKD